jgi:hypothetical protein
MSVDGDSVTTNMNIVNDKGVFVTIENEYSLEELVDKDSPRGINHLYLQHRNEQISRIIEATKSKKNQKELKEELQDINIRNSVIAKFDSIFNDQLQLNIPIRTDFSMTGSHKAKIQVNSTKDGAEIVINGTTAGTDDVVHEYLHLYLIPLRYTDPDLYNAILNSLKDEKIISETDVNRKEELFVAKVAKIMAKASDTLEDMEDTSDFINLIIKAIKTVNPEFDDSNISKYNP